MDFMSKNANNQGQSEQIACSVKNCSYHDGQDCCTASKIHVGPTHAVSCSDTVCSTFKPESNKG